jgi:hypothetical protein
MPGILHEPLFCSRGLRGGLLPGLLRHNQVSQARVSNVRQRYQQGGIERVLKDQAQPKRRQALSGEEEGLMVVIACSPVPDGHTHWTLRMLRNKLVELGVVEQISTSIVQARLKKTNLNRGCANNGVSRKNRRQLCGQHGGCLVYL